MRLRSTVLFLSLFLATAALLQAQGPPPHVARAVDALMEVLKERTDATVDQFVATAVADDWRSNGGTDAVRARVRAIRDAVPADIDDVSIERTPTGVQVVLGSGGSTYRLNLRLTEAGIHGLSLASEDEANSSGQANSRDAAVRDHLRAMEGAHRKELDVLVREFEEMRFSEGFKNRTSATERREVLTRLRAVAAASGGAMIDEDDGQLTLTLASRQGEWKVNFSLGSEPPFALDSLDIAEEARAETALTWQSVANAFKQLEEDGFSGVIHLERDGETVFERAYGMANADLGIPNAVDTIFGIGSTPIDFTVAGIHLLAQRGQLQLDDPLTKFFSEVPADKQAMTLRHLITGASGLPDFHDLPGDWDADLAWIDREEAVRRILAQPLLFAPGNSSAHSHSAYGLAAAVLELVSGESYEQFLRKEIFAPAGMDRTGMYGTTMDYSLTDFAVGRGPSSVGLPNIPPNWGPTSWLVMGSGGMYSTLGDMLRFHRFIRSGKLLTGNYAKRFLGERLGVGGSDRGFYLFEALDAASDDSDLAVWIMNGEGRDPRIRDLSRALEKLVFGD